MFSFVPKHTQMSTTNMVTLTTGLLSSAAIIYFLAADKIKETVIEVFKSHNVAEIELRGQITEDQEPSPLGGDGAVRANQVVKRIEKCENKDFEAIIVNIDSPGGAPVPSDDIRQKLEDVDIPTYTYTRSLCASGGYMIACGTDWIHSRQDSLVGSIGVIANQYKFHDMADDVGITLERFVGGRHKDTHRPLKELSEEERGAWQEVIDRSYDNFVELVAESRDLNESKVRETDAEVLHASQALEHGLVDEVGSREDFKNRVKYHLELDDLKIRRYDGSKKVFGTVDTLVSSAAYSFGRGLTSIVSKPQKKLQYKL